MTPDPRAVLIDFAGRLGVSVIPDLKTPFLVGSVSLMAAALGMMAEDFDNMAARLVDENRAIRGLFGQALALSPPAELASQLAPLAKTGDDDLRISSLQAANNLLRAALVDLHAWAETQTGAKALNDAIWAELSRSTERRRLSTAPF
jgi:hypothetical protein